MGQPQWIILIEAIYTVLLVAVSVRIVSDTRSIAKTLAYLLLMIFVPVAGIIFYFSFGINYRKRKIYNKKLSIDEKLKTHFHQRSIELDQEILELKNESILQNRRLKKLLSHSKLDAPTFANTSVEVLENGEKLFPEMLNELRKAERHIHLEYYIYENDIIGNQIKDLLIEKATQGVEVRFIYDDFGSSGIRRTLVKELRGAGVRALPFNRIKLLFLANRLNYRNHRKIVVIDGKVAFVGGINVSDKYINPAPSGLFWRDTHLMIKGNSAMALQHVFLSDWNFCSGEDIPINSTYFPSGPKAEKPAYLTQIASSGPDSDLPNILYATIQAISSAEKEILLTTPYFIPDISLQEALIIAALSGIDIKLLVPKDGDSAIVNLASQWYFEELLKVGVRIYRYKKGFVHAKTLVTDSKLASVGTANLDLRSFDLNFEVSAFVYDPKVAEQLTLSFYEDLKDSEEIILDQWKKRSRFRKLSEKIVRLISPFM